MSYNPQLSRASLKGTVTIITGAAGGIGRATALALAAEGGRVGITDLNAKNLAETAQMIEEVGGEVVVTSGDICDAKTIDALATEVVAKFGQIDGLVNNAGIVMAKSALDHSKEDFDKVLNVNTWSYLLTAKRVVPEMLKRNRGSVVNIASVGAKVAIPNLAIYCASKAAVVGLTQGMAVDLAPKIRVNAICPGGTDTPMASEDFSQFASREEAMAVRAGSQLQKRYADPLELAKPIMFVLSDDASFMTGASLSIDGGWTAW